MMITESERTWYHAQLTALKGLLESGLSGGQPLETFAPGDLSIEPVEAAHQLFDFYLKRCNFFYKRRLLGDVQAALVRLKNNSFGICTLCRCFIHHDRLKGQPWVRFCNACQKLAEEPRILVVRKRPEPRKRRRR